MANNHIPTGETIADRCWPYSFEKRSEFDVQEHSPYIYECIQKRESNQCRKVINLHSNLIVLSLLSISKKRDTHTHTLLRIILVRYLSLFHILYMQHTSKESNYPIASLSLFIHACLFFLSFFFQVCYIRESDRERSRRTTTFRRATSSKRKKMMMMASTSGRLALLLLAVYLNVVSSQGKTKLSSN